nr:calcium/sodium antiporter [Desulfobulbaceae bacterium]
MFALISGLLLLLAGGESLITGATKLAARLGMSPLLIGLTVVAFGTSMPELFVSINATIGGHPDIMFGNVVGSNIANIGLILALSAIISPLAVCYHRLKVEFILLIAASLVLVAATVYGSFPRGLGLVFSSTLFAYTYVAYRLENKVKNSKSVHFDPENSQQPSYIVIALLCVIGLVLMWFGSDYFIAGAVDLARFFGLSELVIGLTLAAVGTSLPELASCLSAIRKNEADMLVGNIVGSNLFNLLLVLGMTALIKPFDLPPGTLVRDLPVMTGLSMVLVPLALFRKRISRVDGILLLVVYCGYIYVVGSM